ncbi:MAG: hypothetical protein ACUVRZ_02380 [Desulfobacca sp.]|uniref:hypothetical protein n=1 Tax=Desulfobacca sp. TaxID=2067990 RepID=UPI00404A68A4
MIQAGRGRWRLAKTKVAAPHRVKIISGIWFYCQLKTLVQAMGADTVAQDRYQTPCLAP